MTESTKAFYRASWPNITFTSASSDYQQLALSHFEHHYPDSPDIKWLCEQLQLATDVIWKLENNPRYNESQ